MEYGIIDFVGLSSKGLGKDAFSFKLKKEDISFMEIKSEIFGKKSLPFFKANIDKLKEFYSLKDIRRLDKYARIVLLLSSEILKNINQNEKEDMAVILGTSYGSFKTNCDFLDTIILQGFEYASPMLFTGTVHNSPLAPLGIFQGLRGTSYCISNFEKTFSSSLYLADLLLSSMVCEKILLIFADEISDLLLYGFSNILKIDEDNIRTIPQEGGCAFLLGFENFILPLKKINDFLKERQKNMENYGFTYYPEAFELLINLNKIDIK